MKTYDEIVSHLRKQQYAPVYFLYGEEPYYIDRISDFIERYVLDEAEKAFDQEVVYGRDIQDASQLISMARQYPMAAPYHVIIFKEAQALKKWDGFEVYLRQPAEQTILVICHKGKPDGRIKVFKDLMKSDYAMESVPLRDHQINKWILDYIRDWNAQAKVTNQVRIDEKVVQILADSLGTDLTRITLELKKLIDGRPEGVNVIDAALVERNVGISKDYNSFELQQAFVNHDIVKANRITQYYASAKKHPIQMELSLVFNFFSNLMIYHYLADKSQASVAQQLKVPPFAVKDYAAAARWYNAGKTFSIIGYIRDIDARSKGIDNPSAGDADLWKELIYKIMH